MRDEKKIEGPVFVTGATGFIGKRVMEKLLSHQIPSRALVLPGEKLPPGWEEQVEIVRGSISDPKAVQTGVSGTGGDAVSGAFPDQVPLSGKIARTIIHLAAVVSDWGDEKKFWEFTVEGSRLLFAEALKNGSRVILISSIVVYGDNIRTQVCHEDVGFGKTFGPYSRTKQAQEKLAWEYHKNHGMPLTVIRPANVYGPGSGPWLHDVVNQLKSGAPGLISGGNMNAGLIYVDNLADLILLAASSIKQTVGPTMPVTVSMSPGGNIFPILPGSLARNPRSRSPGLWPRSVRFSVRQSGNLQESKQDRPLPVKR